MSLFEDQGVVLSDGKDELRATQFVLSEKGAALFDEDNYVFEIHDEAAGEFISIKELCDDPRNNEIRIDSSQVEMFCYALNQISLICRNGLNK